MISMKLGRATSWKYITAMVVLTTLALHVDAQSDGPPGLRPRNTLVRSLRIKDYPEEAAAAGIEGTVLIAFTLDSLCRVHDRWVEKGLGLGLDEAALRVLDHDFEIQMAGLNNGRCYPDTLRLPVRFSSH